MEKFAGPSQWGCCGVTAVAMALQLPFDHVFYHMKKKFGRNGNWKGSTSLPQRTWALHHFGATFKLDGVKSMHLQLWQFAAKNSDEGRFIIDLNCHHCVYFQGGLIYDQGHPSGIHFSDYPLYGNAYIDKIIEVTSIQPPASDALSFAEIF